MLSPCDSRIGASMRSKAWLSGTAIAARSGRSSTERNDTV